MPDDRIPAKIAGSFAATTGIERDDLFQEARLAVWSAEARGCYDPHKAAWSTFSTICATRHLCSVAEVHRRKHPPHEELGDWLPSAEPSPEDRAIFLELLRQLPEDARTIINLALSGVIEGMAPGCWQGVRRLMDWPAERTNAAVAEIVSLLRGPMMRRT